MDPEILKRVCDEVGFTVEEMGFVGRQGREEGEKQHAGVIAVKPA